MHKSVTDPAAIAAEIDRICALPLDGVRRRWQVVFGRKPPGGLNKDLLGRMIAQRLQEQAFGGLDRDSLSLLEGFARQRGSLGPKTRFLSDYLRRCSCHSPICSCWTDF